MKLTTAFKWDNTDFKLDGLLYFSQRLDEMLFHYTVDLYKAPIQNTHLLLKEYLNILESEDISSKYLPMVLNELKLSLSKDIVVKRYWGSTAITKVLEAFKNLPEKAQASMIRYLNHVWGDTKYYEWCCEYLKEIAIQNNQKEKIELALKCFLPELIGKGYSAEYIFHYNKKFLLQIKEPSMDIFLSRFDCKKRKYKVYIAAEKWINTFETLLTQRIGVDFRDDGNYRKYLHDGDHSVVHIDNIEALDDNGAACVAFERINLFLRFYAAIDNKEQPKFQETAMVIEGENVTPTFVPFAATEYSVIQGMKVDEASKVTEKLITDLIMHSRCSLHQLTRAIDLHNYSLCSQDYNSGFLNLWSVLEVLSLKEMGMNDLEQVAGTLLPILEMKYYNSVINDFAIKIKEALKLERYDEILIEIAGDLDEIEKIAALLMLEKHDELRQKLVKQLEDYPILRHRIHILSEAAKEKRNLLSYAAKYKQRVEWHLSRIYRTRNSLAHSGEASVNIRYIGEHLHYYVDMLMLEVLQKLTSGVQFCTVDNAILDSLLACDVLKKQLNRKGAIDDADISILINPIFTIQQKFEYTCDCE